MPSPPCSHSHRTAYPARRVRFQDVKQRPIIEWVSMWLIVVVVCVVPRREACWSCVFLVGRTRPSIGRDFKVERWWSETGVQGQTIQQDLEFKLPVEGSLLKQVLGKDDSSCEPHHVEDSSQRKDRC